ncbi:hypothetical protein [Streptomyces sp. NPDC056660]|uniref:hypothetical protein n=1 Tax=Streptomyces sp. NPDC056660 TaxID=3345897 RepID=UPI0036A1CDA2
MRYSKGSRWSVRGLVADPLPAAEIGRRLGFTTPVEFTTITAPVAGSGPAYLWVSRNRSERVPDQATQDETLRRMHRLDGYQRAFTGRFRAETETLLDKAAHAGLRVVCNDPRGDWGSERVDARTFTRLISHLFSYRHGADALVYGEANAMTMRPCIQSGYVGQVPRIIPGPHPVHVNVAWADHPVGTFGTDGQAPGTPPSFTDTPYAHYSVGRLAPESVTPFTERALTFLDVRG